MYLAFDRPLPANTAQAGNAGRRPAGQLVGNAQKRFQFVEGVRRREADAAFILGDALEWYAQSLRHLLLSEVKLLSFFAENVHGGECSAGALSQRL